MIATLKKVSLDLRNTEIARQAIGDCVEKVLKVSENMFQFSERTFRHLHE